MGKFIDLTGQKFGRLTVIKRAENAKCGNVRWLCQCDCGKKHIAQGCSLKCGNIKSCRCLHKEIIIQTNKQNIKHGHNCQNKTSITYMTWAHMIQRCTNPNVENYKDYGGRGIKVCEVWLKFEGFLQDMGEKPEGLSIDRIDNDGDYCPENCKWSTIKEQNRNMRTNRLFTINNVTKCLAEWCEIYHKPYYKVWQRINIYKWTIEEALEIVPRGRKK